MTLVLAATLVCWLAGFALTWRMPACRDARPPAPCRFAIVIPARNEEANLPALLESIAAQSVRPAQVLVVDDHSTDGSADVARRMGATVLPSAPLPAGWRGKTWACWQGTSAAEADVLMFLDADTRLEPGGLARIVNAYHSANGSAVSVCPYHRVPRAFEQLSAFFNLVMVAGIGAFCVRPSRRAGLFGQMLMVSRERYDRAGGHERVKGKVLENLWLAGHLRESGTPVRCFIGRGALSVRMYPGGLGSLIEGWTKGFASGAGATPPVVMLMIVAWLSGAVSAVSLFGRTPARVAVLAYALYAAQVFVLLRRIGSFRAFTAILYPIPLLFFFALFARSAFRSRRPVTWKGRLFRAD